MNDALSYTGLNTSILEYPKLVSSEKKKGIERENLQKLCFAPSELFGQQIAQPMGYVAEKIISFKLVDFFAKNKISIDDLYADYSFAGPIDKELIGFLIQKNPNLSKEAIDEISTSYNKRPDFLISSSKLRTFYEIKPNSPSGRSKGKSKLTSIDAFFKKYALLYKRGEVINGLTEFKLIDSMIDINDIKIPFKASINFNQENGLILYKICITTDWEFIIKTGNTDKILEELYKFFRQMLNENKSISKKISRLIEEVSDIPKLDILLISSLIFGVAFLSLTSPLVVAFTTAIVSIEAIAKESLDLKK